MVREASWSASRRRHDVHVHVAIGPARKRDLRAVRGEDWIRVDAGVLHESSCGSPRATHDPEIAGVRKGDVRLVDGHRLNQ
jgi:hypothetical protein